MPAAIPQSRWTWVTWLSAFVCPTIFFVLLLLADQFHVPSPPEVLVAALFYLIPVAALLVCAAVVWTLNTTVPRKLGLMLFTALGMLLQFGLLLAMIVTATGG